MSVRQVRVVTAATALTWSTVTAVLVHRLTLVATAKHPSATTTIRASTVVLVMALGCASAHLVTQVVTV